MMNPITDLTAGEFLVFYGAVICAVVVPCLLYRRIRDRTRDKMPPPDAGCLEPFEVAYLRGGQNELTRVIIVSLVERGYLELQTRAARGALERLFEAPVRHLVRTSRRPEPGTLSETERVVYDWFSEARLTNEVLAGELPAVVGSGCLQLEERLQQEHLLSSDGDSMPWHVLAVGAIIIGGTGASRVLVGLIRDRPVGFLLMMLLAGLLWLAGACGTQRLTALGRACLKRIQARHEHLRASDGTQHALTAAVFGFGVLAGTPLEALGAELRAGSPSDAGGCGDACGDGCGGCGGCCG